MNIIFWIKKYCLSFISISVFFILWEIVSRLDLIDPLFISSPSKIFSGGIGMISSGEILPHLFASLEALSLGFFLAVIIGVSAGLAIGSSRTLHKIFLPYVFALNSLPTVAVIPLVIIWLGIGMYAKIFIVFLMALKPIIINTISGVNNIDGGLVKMARSFGAGPFQILKTITFFGVLSFFFSGSRIAVGRSMTGVIIGEAFGYGKGLGFLVVFYGNTFHTAKLMFVILILLAISLMAVSLITVIEKKVISWKH